MITIYNIKRNILKDNKSYILTELRGLSTDTKPIQIENNLIANGSVFIEIDTQDVYIYDGENEIWLPESNTQEVTPNVNTRNILSEENIEEPIKNDEVIIEEPIKNDEER